MLNIRIILLATLLITICAQRSAAHPVTISDLGLDSFVFFKPNPNNPTSGESDNFFVKHFNRAKAVTVYFRNLLFGHPVLRMRMKHVVDPREGEGRRTDYQWKYGYRGEKLIRALGEGGEPYNMRRIKLYN